MDLRQLTTLVAIADHGSFSAAARALYTVQSNVSGHVARLERELGVTLVDRQRGGLTDEGVIVVERSTTPQDLGPKLNRTAADVVRFLMQQGEMVTATQSLTDDMIDLFAAEVGAEIRLVNPGEERSYLAAGFVPTPRTIRFIGKRLVDEAPPLRKRRDAWRFTLGDLDFF